MSRFFNSTSGLWLVRQILQFGGAYLVFKGYLSAEQVGQALEAIFTIGGPIALLGGLAANVYSTFRSHVTVGGQKVPMKALPPSTKETVKTSAKVVVEERKGQTIVDILGGIFGRKP